MSLLYNLTCIIVYICFQNGYNDTQPCQAILLVEDGDFNICHANITSSYAVK